MSGPGAALSANHPCFSPGAHERFARVHLPVAPVCNVHCGFCDRRFSCVNESRPGVTAEVIKPATALAYLRRAAAALPNLAVAGIAGPGDPLANPHETLETLSLARKEFPRLMLCVSTNGLALPELAGELARLGVSHVTVTVNAARPETAARIYQSIGCGKGQDRARTPGNATHGSGRNAPEHPGATPRTPSQTGDAPVILKNGIESAAGLIAAQREGIAKLKSAGVAIKINTVTLSGLNEGETAEIAEMAAGLGADLMNLIRHIPVPGTALGHLQPLPRERMARLREDCGAFIPQMRHCARCRADAAGLIGQGGRISDFQPAGSRPLCRPEG